MAKEIQVNEAMQKKLLDLQTEAAQAIQQIQMETNRAIQQVTEAYILGQGGNLEDGYELSPDFKTITKK